LKKKLVVLFLCLLLSGCATVPVTGRRQISLVSFSQLFSLSNDSFNKLMSESKLSQEAEKVAMLEDVGRNIALATEEFLRENNLEKNIEKYKWEFKLIEDDKKVNAFAMPGGKVAVYTGILPIAKDENGLATIVGHEIAHVIANHGGERMSQLLLVQLGGVALSVALKKKPDQTRQLVSIAYGFGASLGVILPYSRTHETEADRIGLIIMAKAGYDPREAISFWERMSEQDGKNPPEFLSTHPAPKRRIDDIRKSIPEAMEYYNN